MKLKSNGYVSPTLQYEKTRVTPMKTCKNRIKLSSFGDAHICTERTGPSVCFVSNFWYFVEVTNDKYYNYDSYRAHGVVHWSHKAFRSESWQRCTRHADPQCLFGTLAFGVTWTGSGITSDITVIELQEKDDDFSFGASTAFSFKFFYKC